jgi:hypothetical protein
MYVAHLICVAGNGLREDFYNTSMMAIVDLSDFVNFIHVRIRMLQNGVLYALQKSGFLFPWHALDFPSINKKCHEEIH